MLRHILLVPQSYFSVVPRALWAWPPGIGCYIISYMQQLLLWYLKRLEKATVNLLCIVPSNN